jgi:hypothetical protein
MAVPPRTPPPPAISSAKFVKPDPDFARMFLLIWADSGAGKTTLAATAPGVKCIVQFDPGGHLSLANRSDYYVLDVSGSSAATSMAEFNSADPFGIKAFIQEHPEVETIVVDSVTTLAFQALQYGVTRVPNSSIEVPGRHGYGTRNNIMRRCIQSIMQIAGGLNKNLIVIAHEGAPDEDSKTITMSLSQALANDVSLRFNEVWHMQDMGNKRHIHIRAHGRYKPMKSRMFLSNGATSFVWEFDADTLQGDGIAEWMTKWQANGGRKISLPTEGGAKRRPTP